MGRRDRSQGFVQNHVVDGTVVLVKDAAQTVAQCGLELGHFSTSSQRESRRLRPTQAPHAGLAEGDLNDAVAVQWNVYPGSLTEPGDVLRVAVARRNSEVAPWSFGALDRRSEHARGGERGLAGPWLPDDLHSKSAFGCRHGAGQPDQTLCRSRERRARSETNR